MLCSYGEDLRTRAIGIMDSGIGGLTVLQRAHKLMPQENFLYFGDSAHTPYGTKDPEWVLARTDAIISQFMMRQVKAIVIACNTATSVAAQEMREKYPDIPILGVEPALKPAAQALSGSTILVMATPMTLHLDKYQRLADTWGKDCTIVSVSCDGLAERIERGNLQGVDLLQQIDSFVGRYKGIVQGVVLGCTHYLFAASAIKQVLGPLPLFDGSQGTAKHLQQVLQAASLDCKDRQSGTIEYSSSLKTQDMATQYRSYVEWLDATAPLFERGDD